MPLCRRYVYWETAAVATAVATSDIWCIGERQGEEGAAGEEEEEEEKRGLVIE